MSAALDITHLPPCAANDNDNRALPAALSCPRRSTAFHHLARGNVTRRGEVGLSHDWTDQPWRIRKPGWSQWNAYDGNLKRVVQYNWATRATDAIYSVYSSQMPGISYRYKDATNVGTAYLSIGAASVRIGKTGAALYTHSDHLGSPVVSTREDGSVNWREAYLPYGEKSLRDARNDDNTGFTGHIYDHEIGLTYMQARYYDPVLSRFLSVDPVTFLDKPYPGQFNRYAYTWNDPINANDPDGEFINFVVGAAIGVAVEAYSIHKEGGDIFDVKGNAGRYGKSAAIGAISGGVGGAIAKQGASIAGKTALAQVGKAGGGAVGNVGTGALGGAAAGSTAETLTQVVETGGISDGGAIAKAGVTGALIGGAAGGAQAGVQQVARSGTINPNTHNFKSPPGQGIVGPIGTSNQGSTVGAAAGVATNVGGEITKTELEENR